MLFKPELCEAILKGQKTQTRRIVKPGETCGPRLIGLPETPQNRLVRAANGRLKWYTGGTYAVQPGRGKPGIGRIRITRIRQELLHDVTDEDAVAEGCQPGEWHSLSGGRTKARHTARYAFKRLWIQINGPGAWAANPEVWVLEFELVEDGVPNED